LVYLIEYREEWKTDDDEGGGGGGGEGEGVVNRSIQTI
jgi:hypothetical protein